MQFLKKNYEKVLLGLVLLGLVATVVILFFYVSSEKQKQAERRDQIINHPVKPLEPPVLTDAELLLQRAAQTSGLDLVTTNKLFNPVRWQKAQDGHPFITEGDKPVRLLQVTKSTPLYYTISLDSVAPTEAGSPARYVIGVDQQAGARPKGKRSIYLSNGEKKDPLILREVKGPPENPTALVFELTDTGEQISVSKDKPFRRVDGYVVDLKYPPENKSFQNKRVDSAILFGGNQYNVVVITQDEVVISAPNQKKLTIKYSAAL
jgi:hypothetical protein